METPAFPLYGKRQECVAHCVAQQQQQSSGRGVTCFAAGEGQAVSRCRVIKAACVARTVAKPARDRYARVAGAGK